MLVWVLSEPRCVIQMYVAPRLFSPIKTTFQEFTFDLHLAGSWVVATAAILGRGFDLFRTDE